MTYIIITLLEARNALLFNKLIGFSCLKQHPKEMKPKKIWCNAHHLEIFRISSLKSQVLKPTFVTTIVSFFGCFQTFLCTYTLGRGSLTYPGLTRITRGSLGAHSGLNPHSGLTRGSFRVHLGLTQGSFGAHLGLAQCSYIAVTDKTYFTLVELKMIMNSGLYFFWNSTRPFRITTAQC